MVKGVVQGLVQGVVQGLVQGVVQGLVQGQDVEGPLKVDVQDSSLCLEQQVYKTL